MLIQNRYWISYSHCETGQAPVPGVYPVTEVGTASYAREMADMLLTCSCTAFTSHLARHRILKAEEASARRERSECFEDGDCIASTVQVDMSTLSVFICCGVHANKSCFRTVQAGQMSLYREELEQPFLEVRVQPFRES
ncbi:hypothetical protein GQ600_21771 [Phytophthora cactorum]|nr:hypothetical protein GQ600_21771 [Phytophthora cactorum]